METLEQQVIAAADRIVNNDRLNTAQKKRKGEQVDRIASGIDGVVHYHRTLQIRPTEDGRGVCHLQAGDVMPLSTSYREAPLPIPRHSFTAREATASFGDVDLGRVRDVKIEPVRVTDELAGA